MDRVYKHYVDVQGDLESGDLLLFHRGSGLFSRSIQAFTVSEYSHAAKVGVNSTVWCREVREWIGGRSTPLESMARKYPGRIDVFKVDTKRWPEYNRAAADSKMAELTGHDYGYWNVIRMSFLYLPFIRHVVRPPTTDEIADGVRPFCSQAVSIADTYAGVDPVPNTPHKITSPGQLATSLLYGNMYMCTLK